MAKRIHPRPSATAPLIVAALAGCTAASTYHNSTCDFLAAPARFAGLEVELVGYIIRLRNGSYVFESLACERPYRLPLVWRGGVRSPDAIQVESAPMRVPAILDMVVKGSLEGTAGDQSAPWLLRASDYYRLQVEL